MRSAKVFYNGVSAGVLSKKSGVYRFVYDKDYLRTSDSKPITVMLPKREKTYRKLAMVSDLPANEHVSMQMVRQVFRINIAFAKKAKINNELAATIIDEMIEQTKTVKSFLQRSFLSKEAKTKYLGIIETRRNNLLTK